MSDEVTAEELRCWLSGLDELFARVAGRFGRVEPRRQARAYVMGLLAHQTRARSSHYRKRRLRHNKIQPPPAPAR